MSENEMNQSPKAKAKPGPKPKAKAKVTVPRGKTGVDLPPALQDKTQVAASREEAAHSADRPARVAMGNVSKLEVPKSLLEDGYYHRWFANKEGRIEQAKAAYYEFVVDEQGNNYKRASGPDTMYLMKLKQEYRDEDLKLKAKRVAATMDVEASIGANEYAPDQDTGRAEGGTSAISRS